MSPYPPIGHSALDDPLVQRSIFADEFALLGASEISLTLIVVNMRFCIDPDDLITMTRHTWRRRVCWGLCVGGCSGEQPEGKQTTCYYSPLHRLSRLCHAKALPRDQAAHRQIAIAPFQTYPAAISRVALIGSFNTLQSALKFASRGLT